MNSDPAPRPQLGGVVHSYLGYDPKQFPSPTKSSEDGIAMAAMDHLMQFGNQVSLTEEELANAIEIDPSQISGLGPSLESLIALLEARKARILETFDPISAFKDSIEDYKFSAQSIQMPKGKLAKQIERAITKQSIPELERIWYRAEYSDRDLANSIMKLIKTLGTRLTIEQMLARYVFSGNGAHGDCTVQSTFCTWAYFLVYIRRV